MIIRERYLKLIRPFYDQNLIKVLIGIRRSGKSVILTQIIRRIYTWITKKPELILKQGTDQ